MGESPSSEGIAVVPLNERITWEFNVVTRTSTGEATAALLEQLLAAYRPPAPGAPFDP